MRVSRLTLLPQQRRFFRLLALATVASVVVTVAYDFTSFLASYHAYRDLSSSPALPPSAADEGLVVLTGDRSRIPRALELLQRRDGATLIVSGTGKGTTLKDLINAQGNPGMKLPELWHRIVLESLSSSTLENATETEKIFSQLKLRSLILITSDYHMLRALSAFRRVFVGLQISAYPVSSESGENFLARRYIVLSEYLKWLGYRLVDSSHLTEIQK